MGALKAIGITLGGALLLPFGVESPVFPMVGVLLVIWGAFQCLEMGQGESHEYAPPSPTVYHTEYHTHLHLDATPTKAPHPVAQNVEIGKRKISA
jgi:hypothetical protein